MSFRLRLGLFFVAALVAVQALTAVMAYRVTRQQLIEAGQRQLDVAARAFARQLDDISGRVASSVQVLALDFALRSAIAQRDEATVLSALRNHGRRVGATRMLLVDVDGGVEADTRGALRPGRRFPFDDLAAKALERPAAAVVAWDGRAYWMVVVPVFAPDLVGMIAAAIPVDDRLLARLQEQSALPGSIELATIGEGGRWTVVASGRDGGGLTRALAAHGDGLPVKAEVLDAGGREFVARAVLLNRSRQSAPVAAVLGYSVDEALRPYRSLTAAWALLSLLGLAAGLVGAWLIARGVSRPVERLAASARRIAAGDYGGLDEPAGMAAGGAAAVDASPRQGGRGHGDELAQLASAFANMAHALREREARILHQSGHDQVTGLPNRLAAEARIEHALAERPGGDAALLMVGLGRVPEIIKTMGHAVCDRLMREAGGRVRGPAGAGMVARATETQFSVFLPCTGRQEAIATAFRVVEALSEPYREAELTLDLAPAVGIALAPLHGAEATMLLRRAEIALIGALGAEEPVGVYDPGTDPHRPERLSLMGDLREAIEQGRVDMHYQPKLNLATQAIDGAEGLVRWTHPDTGPVAPDTFIPLAEETGNIRRLTRWALATGIAQAGRWNDEGRPLRVAINVSARDLDDAGLARRVAELLAIHRAPAERIVLEITESAIMGKPEAAVATLRGLAALGVELAIDDFGVGQSSFAYLRRLPVRELKIDKTFITHLASAREDRVIVRSIVDMGHQLGYRITAEGVEDAGALAYLAEVGCDHAQGFLIARALEAGAFDRFVVSGARPWRA